MESIEHFGDLPNIDKNIEKYLQSKNSELSNKQHLNNDSDEKMNKIAKNQCIDTIKVVEKGLVEDNSKLQNSLPKQKDEILKNFEYFIKKLETETLEHIENLEQINLTEKEKRTEYIKCIKELENISLLTESLNNCVDLSEKNLTKFLNENLSLDKDSISSYLQKNENDLNDCNIYNYIRDDKLPIAEKIYNGTKSAEIKNYMFNKNSNLDEAAIKLKKLKINKFSDFPKVKDILYFTNKEDDLVQNKLMQISINNISPKDFKYIFSKSLKPRKPNESDINLGKKKTRSPSVRIKDRDKDELTSKFASKNVLKNINEFEILENKRNNQNGDKPIKPNIKLEYPNVLIKNCDLTDINFIEIFSNVNMLKLYSCQLSFDFYNNIKNKTCDNISELYLENCNIVNENFNEIIFSIIKDENLRSSLKILSFKNNYINSFFLYKYILDGSVSTSKFDRLEYFDLSYNKISIIDNRTMSGISSIRVIDLSNNFFQFPSEFNLLHEIRKKRLKKKKTVKEEKSKLGESFNQSTTLGAEKIFKDDDEDAYDFLFLLSSNIALLRGEYLNKYIKYLIEVFPKLNYPLKSINLSGLFYRTNYHDLLPQLNLTIFQSSLVEINLSCCNITDEELANLLVNEFCIINIKVINLSNNKLTDKIFELLIENKCWDIYRKIKKIDLSNNDINLKNPKIFKEFAKLFDSIKTIVIQNTNIEQNINNYIKKLVIRFNEEQNDGKCKTEYNPSELSVKELINNKNQEDCFNNNSNIKLKMKNTIDYKFIEAAQKLKPHIFDKINIEFKFTEPN